MHTNTHTYVHTYVPKDRMPVFVAVVFWPNERKFWKQKCLYVATDADEPNLIKMNNTKPRAINPRTTCT